MKKPKCTSIYDLAEITGVSYATVSRVFNNRGMTSSATREKVLKAADDLKFKPKMKARRQTIGIIMGIERMLVHKLYGYLDTILIRLLNGLAARDLSIEFFTDSNIGSLQNCLLDGLICTCWDERVAAAMHRMPNMPVVLINCGPVPGCTGICSDHEQSGRMAAEYLIADNHERAGIILDCRVWGNEIRARSFMRCYEEKVPGGLAMAGYLAEQGETILINNMLSAGVSAIFLAAEGAILQLVNSIKLLNVNRKPLHIISMENHAVSPYMDPPITTIAQPFDAMVEKAVSFVCEQIETRQNSIQNFVFENTMIIRHNDHQ